jgi:mRNA interferase HigB
VKIENQKAVEKFVKDHARAHSSFEIWLDKTKAATWKTPTDVIATFPKSDCVDGLWIFNVGGNNYRLTALIGFNKQELKVVKVMTHAEYDKEKY